MSRACVAVLTKKAYNRDVDTNILRQQLITLLKGGQAHMSVTEAVAEFPERAMNTIFPNGTYSVWHLLEHIRRTQKDILDFMTAPDYVEPEWPKDYWPQPHEKATKKDWDKTIKDYFADLKTLENMVRDEKLDLSAKVPNGNGQTYLREFLLVADHTSYHIGEFAIMRQTMNTWSK